jgi:hypothetical protein
MAHVPKSVILDAKRRARELEKFEYRKKRRELTSGNDDKDESVLRAKFKALPFATMTVEEKRRALQKLVGLTQ